MIPEATKNILLTERALAVIEYLGAAPFTHRWRRERPDTFVNAHHHHALALLLAFLIVVLLYVVGIALVTVAIMTSRTMYEQYHIEGQTLSILRKIFLAWAVFWVFAMGTALLGREAYLPGIWRIARRPRLMRFTARLCASIMVFIASVLLFAAYAETKVREDARPGKVYILYENGGGFPRWLFALGFYPMTRAAEERFGPGNVILQRVTREALHRGLKESTFLFLGTHGMHQGILVPDGFFKTSDVAPGEANAGLQFVYMAGCDQPADWESAFAPAKVVTYNRLTSVAEHVWWMWNEGPRTIRALK